jgi:diguanylate cyclase (GGDEF)-like protein
VDFMNSMDTSKIVGTTANQVPKERIFSSIIQQLYRSSATGIIANAILSIVLVWSLWDNIPQFIAIIWLGANLVMNFLRLLITIYVLKRDVINERNWKRWATTHLVVTGTTSSLWGLAALLFYIEGRIEFQVFFAMIVVGMASAALPMIAIYFPSYVAYFLPSIVPLMGVFIAEGDKLHVRMAILVGIYIFTMLTTARLYYSRIIESTSARLQLDLLAHVDALTGVANRRAYDKLLDKEWRRMKRTRQPLSLLIIDVDFFKEYNDAFGHQAGDDCLIQIARTIEDVFRRSGDFVARLGGEEFVALVPVTESDAVAELAEQARQAVFRLRIPHPNPDHDYVTISIGLSTTLPNEILNASALYESADKALYAAKDEGRNRVCIDTLKSNYIMTPQPKAQLLRNK